MSFGYAGIPTFVGVTGQSIGIAIPARRSQARKRLISNLLNCTKKSRLRAAIFREISVPQGSKIDIHTIKGEPAARGKIEKRFEYFQHRPPFLCEKYQMREFRR